MKNILDGGSVVKCECDWMHSSYFFLKPQKGSFVRIPITNGDSIRCLSLNKIYWTLLGFEPATPRKWSERFTTAPPSSRHDERLIRAQSNCVNDVFLEEGPRRIRNQRNESFTQKRSHFCTVVTNNRFLVFFLGFVKNLNLTLPNGEKNISCSTTTCRINSALQIVSNKSIKDRNVIFVKTRFAFVAYWIFIFHLCHCMFTNLQ